MNFILVELLTDRDVQDVEEVNEKILLNVNHIVSVKPINLLFQAEVKRGYWVRMSNGKKYRCLDVPKEFKDLIID